MIEKINLSPLFKNPDANYFGAANDAVFEMVRVA